MAIKTHHNMKKLLLILSAVFVCVAGWTQTNDNSGLEYTLNPYAYNLFSEFANEKLTLNYKLNAVPNLNDGPNDAWKSQQGIQVYAYEVENPTNTYLIWAVTRNEIQNAHNNNGGAYSNSYDFVTHNGKDLEQKFIPRGKELSWKVVVNGRNNTNSTLTPPGANLLGVDYTLPRFWNLSLDNYKDFGKRHISPSIAINTNPKAPNFGHLYIVDNIARDKNKHGDSYWAAASTGRGIYVYEPNFKTKAHSGNKVALQPTNTTSGGFVDYDEPRDICISKNGRIFVCSYTTASDVAVWEISREYTTWTSILTKEEITKKLTGSTTNKHSVVSMDVKGEGDDITLLLLCKGSTNDNNNSNFPLLKCVEYNVKNKTLTEIQLPQQIYNSVYYNDDINAHARIAYDEVNNWIWCGFGTNANKSYVRAFDPTIAIDNTNVDKNLKVNESFGTEWGGEAFLVKGDMIIKSYRNSTTSTTHKRAGIIFRKINKNQSNVANVITDTHYYMSGTITGDIPQDGNYSYFLDANYQTLCYNEFSTF